MSFTYDFPIVNNIHKIRLRIGDTNPDDYLLEDEEIGAYLDSFGSVTRAIIQICYMLAVKFTTQNYSEIQVDDIKIKQGQAKDFTDLAKSLERSIELGVDPDEIPNICIGGVIQTELNNNKQAQINGQVVKNPFNKGVFDIKDKE